MSDSSLVAPCQPPQLIPPTPNTYRMVSLGCRTNQYEGGAYCHQLDQLGWRRAQEGECASVGIVNTCTVTASADSHSRHAIRDLARENPGMQIWVTGCLAESQPEALRAIEGVSAVVSNLEKEFLVNYLLPDSDVPEFNLKVFEGHTRAFVKVQDGCNSFCSYCVIPYVRGRSRSRTLASILAEVEQLLDQGYQEIVLTGINIGDFDGGDGKSRLVDLVRAVDGLQRVKRLRLSSIDPDEVDADLQEAILKGRSTCHSMHIVLQSGSNFVLKRMGRKYTRQVFLDTCERLRAADPHFSFTTDIIVGFPGESQADFEQTLDLVRSLRFAKVHVFPYSSRPQTKAARFEDQVDVKVKSLRKTQLLHLSEQMAFQLRQDYVNQTMWVLTESSEEGQTVGYSDHFLRVRLPEIALPANQLIHVKTYDNASDALLAQLV